MAAEYDQQYKDTREAITKGTSRPPPSSPYKNVWSQLTVIGNLIYKGDTMIIPDASDQPGATDLRTKILDIAHEGHPGESTMKRHLRAHVWFPYMARKVKDVVQGCLQC